MTPLHAPTFSAPRNPTVAEAAVSPPQCPACGIPLDAEQFDNSTVHNTPERGRLVTLASFQLPPKYCGVLRFFSQFTDRHARDPGDITTPGLRWMAGGRLAFAVRLSANSRIAIWPCRWGFKCPTHYGRSIF